MFPGTLLPPTYQDPDNPGHLLARSEVERRADYIQLLYQQLGEQHTLSQLVSWCLHNEPDQRPSAEEVLQHLEQVRPRGSYGSLKMEISRLQVAMRSVLRMETEVGKKNCEICTVFLQQHMNLDVHFLTFSHLIGG